jgi:hypothetical protein
MSIAPDNFPGFLKEEIRKYADTMIPEDAGFL